MRTILILIFGTVALAIAAVIAVPHLVATDWMREQVTKAVLERTGRELVIAGDTSLSLFPNVTLVVTRATLMNPPGREGFLARMDGLDLGLKLMPLLAGRVEVDRLILTGPVINLVIDEAGAENWTFFAAQAPPAEVSPSDQPVAAGGEPVAADGEPVSTGGEPAPQASPLPMIEWLDLGDVQVTGGTVTFEDHRSAAYQEIRDIDATVRLASLDDPLEVDGTMSWQGEPVTFRLSLAEPRALATGTPTAAVVDLDSAQVQATYNGTLTAKAGLDAEGELEIATPSFKDLTRWLGGRPPRIEGLRSASLTGTMKAGRDSVSLSNARLNVDGASAEGGILVSLTGPRPLVQATLATDQIDVNRYLRLAESQTAAAAAATAGDAAAARELPAEWDAEPIDLSGLRSVDADLRVSTRQLLYRDLKIGQSALAVTLKDGVLTVDLSELQLYDGRAVGKLTLNGAGETPAIAASFSIDGVAGRQMLADLAGIEWLEGRGQLSGSLASRGLTERRLVGALSGEVALRFTDGAIRGFNIAAMMRGLAGGEVLGWSREEAEKTDFSEFSASFTIAKGVAQTNDISMLGPLVRLSGAGVANLPKREVDFRIHPKVVATLEGQGGEADLSGLEVPLLIRGPWDDTSITPDLEAVIRDPQAAIGTIQAIGRELEHLRNGDAVGAIGDAVQGLTEKAPREYLDIFLGPDGTTEGQGGGEPQAPPPISEDVFNKLLGQ